jgi:hypothetical protein
MILGRVVLIVFYSFYSILYAFYNYSNHNSKKNQYFLTFYLEWFSVQIDWGPILDLLMRPKILNHRYYVYFLLVSFIFMRFINVHEIFIIWFFFKNNALYFWILYFLNILLLFLASESRRLLLTPILFQKLLMWLFRNQRGLSPAWLSITTCMLIVMVIDKYTL